MKHLAKVDEVLASMVQAQTDAIQEVRNNKISINRVAKESGIARQTFYNNPIITAYIEAYIAATHLQILMKPSKHSGKKSAERMNRLQDWSRGMLLFPNAKPKTLSLLTKSPLSVRPSNRRKS